MYETFSMKNHQFFKLNAKTVSMLKLSQSKKRKYMSLRNFVTKHTKNILHLRVSFKGYFTESNNMF